MMMEQEFGDRLEEAITLLCEEDEAFVVRNMETFETAGLLTHDKGLVVYMGDGSEFQLTIVESKGAE